MSEKAGISFCKGQNSSIIMRIVFDNRVFNPPKASRWGMIYNPHNKTITLSRLPDDTTNGVTPQFEHKGVKRTVFKFTAKHGWAELYKADPNFRGTFNFALTNKTRLKNEPIEGVIALTQKYSGKIMQDLYCVSPKITSKVEHERPVNDTQEFKLTGSKAEENPVFEIRARVQGLKEYAQKHGLELVGDFTIRQAEYKFTI